MSSSAPAASRNEIVARLGPRGWYADHIVRAPGGCSCTPAASDPACDVGDALFRLRIREIARSTMTCPRCGDPDCDDRHRRKP